MVALAECGFNISSVHEVFFPIPGSESLCGTILAVTFRAPTGFRQRADLGLVDRTRMPMQLLILATAMVVTLGAALAVAAGILSLMFRLMSRAQLAASDVRTGSQG